MRGLRALLGTLLLFSTACRGPTPPYARVDLETSYGIVRAVSMESGIIALQDILLDEETIPFRYDAGNSSFDDEARLLRTGEALSVLSPLSTRPNQVRLATYPPRPEETLYVEARDADLEAFLVPVLLVAAGRYGDLVLHQDQGEALGVLAHKYTGAGIYAYREGFMQLVGILNGVFCQGPPGLAFIGINEIARVLPADDSYFERKAFPRRADFEFGMARDLAGERPFATGLGPVPPHAEQAPDEDPAMDPSGDDPAPDEGR